MSASSQHAEDEAQHADDGGAGEDNRGHRNDGHLRQRAGASEDCAELRAAGIGEPWRGATRRRTTFPSESTAPPTACGCSTGGGRGARRALRRWSSRTLSAARCSQMERSFAFASLRAKVRRSPPRAIRRNLLTHPRVAAGGRHSDARDCLRRRHRHRRAALRLPRAAMTRTLVPKFPS